MGSEWRKVNLRDAAKWMSGGTPPKANPEYWDGEIPWISAKSMKGRYYNESDLKLTESGVKKGSKIAPKNSLLLLVRGSILHQKIPLGIAGRDISFNQDVKAIIPNTNFNPLFFYYSLKGIEQELLSKVENTGIGAGKLDTSILFKTEIFCPSLIEQKNIIKFIGSLDDKIELNQKMNETLEAMAQALFKSWFVDFDPVIDNALAAGNPIPDALQKRAQQRQEIAQKNSQNTLDKNTKEIREMFPAGFTFTDELGWIPEDWEVAALGSIVTVKRGGSPRPIKDFVVPKGLHWVKISDATASPNRFISKTKEFIKLEGLKKTVQLKRGSLILSNSATPGLPKFLDIDDACIHDGWLYFPEKHKVNDRLLYHLFLEIRTSLIQQGNGSVFTNLKTDILKEHLLAIPNSEVITAFDNQLIDIHSKLLKISKETSTLSNLRDTLLPKLISGELRIPDAEKMIENI